MKNNGRKKKVCFFCGDITRSGGTERVTALITGQLAALNKYEIIFLSIVEQNETPFFELSDKIKRYVIDKRKQWIAPGPAYIPLAPRLRRFLNKEKIDIIVDIDTILDWLSIPASAFRNTIVIGWEHFNYHYAWQSPVYQKFRRISAAFTARHADYIVTLTHQDEENYRKKLKRRGKIRTISNPIVSAEKQKEDGPREKIILTAGRLTWVKGMDILARIAPDILKKYPEWKWYVLGEGEDRKLLEKTIQENSLSDRLILTGNVTNVEAYMKRAYVYVMTSRSEGLPMVLLEALENCLPMISFDIPTGPSEIIEEGTTGFLVNALSECEMKERISRMIENEELQKKFSQNEETARKRFRMDVILKQWEELLDSLQE